MKRCYLASVPLLLLMLVSACKKAVTDSILFPSSQASATSEFSATDKFVPHELIVKFKNGLDDRAKLSALSQISGTIKERVVTAAMKHAGDNEGFYLVRTPLDVAAAVKLMLGQDVVYTEPNFVYRSDATANENLFTNGSLWGMYGPGTSPANTFGSQAVTAWANGHTGASNVYVGVIDEGAMFNHEDLAANFWTNPFETSNGIDDDGNGYVDDVHGWDFANNDNTTFDGTSDDHGTHVSGTIGAVGGNGKGVAGVNWSVTMISAKFLGRSGGTTANAIKAVDYITDLKKRHQTGNPLDIVATNNSWGGGGFSQGLQDAIERANAQNILFVAAAGNESTNIDATPSYPASYPNANIIAVASITSSGALSSFSNYGATTVDIGAPGSGIYSTVPAGNGNSPKLTSGYASYSGTSMATPHVTGAAALYKSTHSGATAADIKNAILTAGVLTNSLSGKTATGKRLNVSNF